LALETRRASLVPQEAAFLILASKRLEQIKAGWPSPDILAAVSPQFNPDWLTLLCKAQRYDGSWAGEALFGTPTRGEFAAWYSSRSVTSAFCYHALKTVQ
jgi:hypothetical protein